jgi:hypothetical protein
VIGARDYQRSGSIVENYSLRRVECQVGHFLVANRQPQWATVLDGLEVHTLVHEQLIGLRAGRALQGHSRVREWHGVAIAPADLAERLDEMLAMAPADAIRCAEATWSIG